MKYLIITLPLLLALLLSILLVSCASTPSQNLRTFNAALIVEQDYNTVYESVSNLALTENEIDNLITIDSAYKAFRLVFDGKETLDRLETAKLLEYHYAAAKTAYGELRESIDISKLNHLQQFEAERFDDSIVILDKRISELASSENIKDKKDTAYEVLEMLVLSLQIVQMTK